MITKGAMKKMLSTCKYTKYDGEIKDKILKADVDIFAKLSPLQKTKIVQVFKSNEHTVGFIGNGINDASAMKEADIVILLKKDFDDINKRGNYRRT